MIVKCNDCHHEWQCVENDQPCGWCGSAGTSIDGDYMSECDGTIGPGPQKDEIEAEDSSIIFFLGRQYLFNKRPQGS